MAQAALKLGKFGRHTLHQEILESVSALPQMLRLVFVRSHYQNQSLQQISKELRIPVETAESMLQDANEIFYRRTHKFRL